MAVKYFCDRCQREAREWDLKIVRVLAPPEVPLAIEVCPDCAHEIREFARAQTDASSSDGEEPGSGAPNHGVRERLPVVGTASMAAALPLARGLLYLGIVILFFFLGSWLMPG
jgi:hypothetical protein